MSAQSLDFESEIVQRHVNQLSEHFDTVQILVTRYDRQQCTTNIARGTGNWFARYGQMRSFVMREDERERKTIEREDNP